MDWLLILVADIVRILLFILNTAMTLRVLMSLLDTDEESGILFFLAVLTEPFVLPFRLLFHKMNWFRDLPIDMPFLVTAFLLSSLSVVLFTAV